MGEGDGDGRGGGGDDGDGRRDDGDGGGGGGGGGGGDGERSNKTRSCANAHIIHITTQELKLERYSDAMVEAKLTTTAAVKAASTAELERVLNKLVQRVCVCV